MKDRLTSTIQTHRPAVSRRYKRAFDITALTLVHLMPPLLPIWALLWLLIPLAIKLDDRGPVFYRQRRLGKDGQVFTITKFRTMKIDAETRTGAVWATSQDNRVTRVGRFLRWTALDELPQLLNIWKGEMSLVGPRPERPELHEQFVQETPGFEKRLQVLPGLSGLAQISGSYDLSPAEKLRHDLEYIERMSPVLDLKILLLSVKNTLMASWDHPKSGASSPTTRDITSHKGRT